MIVIRFIKNIFNVIFWFLWFIKNCYKKKNKNYIVKVSVENVNFIDLWIIKFLYWLIKIFFSMGFDEWGGKRMFYKYLVKCLWNIRLWNML